MRDFFKGYVLQAQFDTQTIIASATSSLPPLVIVLILVFFRQFLGSPGSYIHTTSAGTNAQGNWRQWPTERADSVAAINQVLCMI